MPRLCTLTCNDVLREKLSMLDVEGGTTVREFEVRRWW